jgi:hypothetical protein
LVLTAEDCIKKVLNEDLLNKIKKISDYISIGIDSIKEKTSTRYNDNSRPHIELVFLIDLKRNNRYWTGKTYPTTKQEKYLLDIEDYKTHFINLPEVGKIMILGCHDLNMFNCRAWLTTGEKRKRVKSEFIKLAKNENPICVLHHPHTYAKIRTWANGFNGLKKFLPSIKYFISTGKYYEANNDKAKWTEINKLLKYSKIGNSIDFLY